MSIMDAQTLLWDSAALTASAVSTNTYDTGAAGNDISIGEPLALELTVDVAADHTTGNETYEFRVIQSANADLSSADVLCSRVISYADLTAGKRQVIPIPPGSITKRYLGADCVLAGTTPTITVTASIKPMSMIENQKHYPKGYTIS